MGIVFQGWDTLLQRKVAIKILSHLMAMQDQVEQGVKILSSVLSNPVTPSLYRDLAGERLHELEGKLPADAFTAAKQAGEGVEIEAIVGSIPAALYEPLAV